MKDQGFTNWEILWQEEGDYEFGWIAGEKEIELQKQYGLPIDKANYQISRQNRPKLDGSQRTYEFTFEDRAKGGKKNVESGHLDKVRKPSRGGSASQKIIYECPICDRKLKGNLAFHNHKKTHKKSL